MSATSTQEAMRTALKAANDLAASGAARTADQTNQLKAHIEEAKNLKTQLDALAELDSVNSYAKSSAGMLALTADGTPQTGVVNVTGMTKSGGSTIGYEQEFRKDGSARRSFELLDQYGEGIQGTKEFQNTNTTEYRDAFKTYVRRGRDSMKAEGLKVLQEGSDILGGFAVPPDILEKVIIKEPAPTRVAGRVTMLTTTRDKLTMPRINYASASDDASGNIYTTGMRVTWTTEVPSSSTASQVTDPVFGQTDIPIFTAMMTLLLTNDMIEDSGFPIVSYMSNLFGQTIDLLKDNMILNGSGGGQPSGILANPGGTNQPAVTNSGQAATIGTGGATGTAIQNLAQVSLSLPEQYDDNAAYVFNKTSTANAIAQILDGNGRPIWGQGYQDAGASPGWKNRLLYGYPTVLSQFMPNIGASTYPILFGDLSGYYLVNRVSFSIQVLREVYATINQIGLVGRVRFGGQLVEPWRVNVLRCHT